MDLRYILNVNKFIFKAVIQSHENTKSGEGVWDVANTSILDGQGVPIYQPPPSELNVTAN